MAKKFYVVWAGRQTGVFDNWPYTKSLIDHFAGAKYKSFPTEAEAIKAFGGGVTVTSAKKGSTKSPSMVTYEPLDACDTTIFCDGACDPNPGKAGSGVAVYRGTVLSELYYGLYNPNGTNNTAELNALHQALLLAKVHIEQGHKTQILCDSQYSINCISLWAYGWKKAGWKKKTGEIKNLAIIQECHELYSSLKSKLGLHHVKAHAGTEGNELADRMAMFASQQKQTDFCLFEEKMSIAELLDWQRG